MSIGSKNIEKSILPCSRRSNTSIASIHPGDYQRVVSLMEKSLYGEIDLEPFEVRAIYVFMEHLAQYVEEQDFWVKICCHYVCFRRKALN